ncbi:hypothetical protein Cgig2_017442 [Carnegiea gigantea]|uniref:High-affinity nitrate transporter n=1 Tax=Carnegiea gigantea TaxID=171969 RepID=A0A9Q1JRA5_9CARY|nr:hypothetical protein Cgig2_017442 [Carnegiea gigantea]
MAIRGLIMGAIFAGFVATCYGEILFSKLPNTLTVTTSPSGRVNLKAGEDELTVAWELSKTKTNIDTSNYKTVKVKLCYSPESQKDRPWRKTEDHLNKDKSCQHAITSKPFNPTNNSVSYKIERDVPTAFYFVRAYVLDANDKEVAYGQTTDDTISITAISGRHVSLDIASAVFSAFSIVSLAGFFYREKKKAKLAA